MWRHGQGTERLANTTHKSGGRPGREGREQGRPNVEGDYQFEAGTRKVDANHTEVGIGNLGRAGVRDTITGPEEDDTIRRLQAGPRDRQ